MGAFRNEFTWNVTRNLSTCPNCASDVIKVRQHRNAEEGAWEDGDLVECQCCSHEGVVELYAGEGCPRAERTARVEWDATDSIGDPQQ